MQIPDLDPITPGIPEITSKIRMDLQSIFLGDFFPYFFYLSVVPDHDAEMFGAIRLQGFHFKNGQKLMLSHFAPGSPLTPS